MHVTGLRPGLTDRLSRAQAPAIWRTARPGGWVSSKAEVASPSGLWVGLSARLRLVSIGLTIAILGIWVADWVQVAQRWDAVAASGLPGRDYTLYMQAATHWLATGDFYPASQLQGPYSIPSIGGAILYPPTTLLLFVPFSFLPALLWWAIPLAIIGWAVLVHRPGPLTWPVLALLLWYPTTNLKLLGGNPTTLWFTAILALATVRPAASALFVLKPSLIPFALARRAPAWVVGHARRDVCREPAVRRPMDPVRERAARCPRSVGTAVLAARRADDADPDGGLDRRAALTAK